MDLHNITGPQDYHKFYHTFSEGLVWLDGIGNPIPLSLTLGSNDLWNSMERRNKVHKHAQTVPAHKGGPSNSSAIDPNKPP